MRIILVGYMGSGKSAVGKALAGHLNLPFIDLDDHIEKELKATIPEIFKEKGEIFFRRKEHEFLKSVLQTHSALVLATGGGTPCYSGNMDLMLASTPYVFYLQLSVTALTKRLTLEKEHRPMISHLGDEELQEFIGKHVFERRTFYAKARYTIPCENKSVEEVVKSIESKLV